MGDVRPPILGVRSMPTRIDARSFNPMNTAFIEPTAASARTYSPQAITQMVRHAMTAQGLGDAQAVRVLSDPPRWLTSKYTDVINRVARDIADVEQARAAREIAARAIERGSIPAAIKHDGARIVRESVDRASGAVRIAIDAAAKIVADQARPWLKLPVPPSRAAEDLPPQSPSRTTSYDESVGEIPVPDWYTKLYGR